MSKKSNTPVAGVTDGTVSIETGFELEKALNSIGMSMYSDDFACKLLAYVLVYGGANEAVTQNKALYFAIRCCQDKLNIHGGEIPNIKLLPVLQQRIQELAEKGEDVPWLQEIIDRYSVQIPPYKSNPEYLKNVPRKPNGEIDVVDLIKYNLL